MRWLCHQCGHRFAEPVFSFEGETISSTEKLGEIVRRECPKCGSCSLAGAANPDPFTPKPVTFK